MAKEKTIYTCTECGGTSPKWLGKCPHCGAWNTLVEDGRRERPASRATRSGRGLLPAEAVATLAEIEATDVERTPTGIDELDRVLGGGIVAGGVVLIGGDPGIGKSTLLLQALDALARAMQVLYVTGEESGAQVALRSRRLGLGASPGARAGRDPAREDPRDARGRAAGGRGDRLDPDRLLRRADLGARLGGAGARMRGAADARSPRRAASTIVLVGHVTKEGALAGPRVLEHMVDTVLYFEGDTHSSFRLVRAIKNRFGAVNEIGVFAMTEKGLKGVSQPERDLPVAARRAGAGQLRAGHAGRHAADAGGGPGAGRQPAGRARAGCRSAWSATAWRCCWRCCTAMPASPALDQDVFVNAVGGVRISEPAADLAVMLAIQSQPARQAAAERLHRLRRSRPGRRGAAGAARPGAAARGGQAGLLDRDRAQGQRAEGRGGARDRGPDRSIRSSASRKRSTSSRTL